jgi:hypothetical protein
MDCSLPSSMVYDTIYASCLDCYGIGTIFVNYHAPGKCVFVREVEWIVVTNIFVTLDS